MTNKLRFDDGPLPQDLAEGCDPEEWVMSLHRGILIELVCHCLMVV